MSSVVISGDSSGAITLTAPAVAGTNTITLPANTGTVITTASTFAGTGPAFSAYLASSQSVTTSVVTKVTLNTEDFDTASCFDSTTNYRFTPNVAGYYQITATLGGNASGTVTTTNIYIYKNGSNVGNVLITNTNAFNNLYVSISKLIYMNGSTDYIELYGAVASTNSPRFDGSSVATYMTGFLARTA